MISTTYRINLVCLGNICRSPMAHSIGELMRKDFPTSKLEFDSCGMYGEPEG